MCNCIENIKTYWCQEFSERIHRGYRFYEEDLLVLPEALEEYGYYHLLNITKLHGRTCTFPCPLHKVFRDDRLLLSRSLDTKIAKALWFNSFSTSPLARDIANYLEFREDYPRRSAPLLKRIEEKSSELWRDDSLCFHRK